MTMQHTNAFPDLDRDLRFIPLGVEEPRVLTPRQVGRYNEVGYLFSIGIFSPGEIADPGLHRRPAGQGAGGGVEQIRGGQLAQVLARHL